MLRIVISACMFAVLAVSMDAHAHTFDNRTFFTFSQPVTLPGVTLPPGTYQFRVADDTTSRKVIQVLDAEGTESYATLHSLAAERDEARAEPEIRFMETASGFPPVVEAWWAEGRRLGYQLVYPREQALRLAGLPDRQPAPLAAASHQADLIAADLTPPALDRPDTVQ